MLEIVSFSRPIGVRVFSVSTAVPSTSATDNTYDSWSFDVIYVNSVSSNHEYFRGFDWLDEDILSESIAETVNGVTHHWNGVINYQTKGTLYRLRTYDAFPSSPTGYNRFSRSFRRGLLQVSVGRTSSHSSYGVVPPQHNLPGSVKEWPVAVATSLRLVRHPKLVAVWSAFHTFQLYEHADGRFWVHAWDEALFATASVIHTSLHIFWFDYQTSELREIRPSYWSNFQVQFDVRYSAGQNYETLLRQRVEAFARDYDYELLNLTRAFPLLEPAVEIPLDRSTLRCPNYEAIFASRDRNPDWGSIAALAYQGLAFSDINGIAYLKDVLESYSAFASFAKTLKALPTKKVKAAAQLFLSVHYGFKLMLADTKSLRDEFIKQSLRDSRKSKCQASKSWYKNGVSYTAYYQVFYNQFGQLVHELDSLIDIMDAGLTLENAWDMTPFSFVIDWFVSIGDVLSSIDGMMSLTQRHDVIAVGRSVKGDTTVIPSQLGLPPGVVTSGIKLSFYARRYTRDLVFPTLLPSVTLNPFNHAIEAAALVISNT